MARIQIIEPQEASGVLKEIYDDLLAKRGKLAEVHKIQSLNPETIVYHMDLYMSIMYAHSPLSRAQREMVAVVVSATNHCNYCQIHHKQALQNYWKDKGRVNQVAQDYTNAELSKVDLTLCDLAHFLAKEPDHVKVTQTFEKLKELELEDKAILDAHLVISYFNFVNRMVLGLGVELKNDQGEGYKH